jgi:hypothetical protein
MSRAIIAAALGILTFVPASWADETGFAGIHAWKQEKGHRICMSDHFHDGSGTGATQKAAQKAAAQSWMEFTAFEYGSAWGSYKQAASKNLDCHRLANGAKSWSCSTSARPCKHYAKQGRNGSKSASR